MWFKTRCLLCVLMFKIISPQYVWYYLVQTAALKPLIKRYNYSPHPKKTAGGPNWWLQITSSDYWLFLLVVGIIFGILNFGTSLLFPRSSSWVIFLKIRLFLCRTLLFRKWDLSSGPMQPPCIPSAMPIQGLRPHPKWVSPVEKMG